MHCPLGSSQVNFVEKVKVPRQYVDRGGVLLAVKITVFHQEWEVSNILLVQFLNS